MNENTAQQLTDLDFIDDKALIEQLSGPPPSAQQVRNVIARSLNKQSLSVTDTAILLRAEDPELQEEIFAAARRLKQQVYGNRIVLFAPLYVGNHCINECEYCGFKRSNAETQRRTLSQQEISEQVAAMESQGHKRLILVCGEHPKYDARYLADCVRTIYATQSGEHGEIRRSISTRLRWITPAINCSVKQASEHTRFSRKPTTTPPTQSTTLPALKRGLPLPSSRLEPGHGSGL